MEFQIDFEVDPQARQDLLVNGDQQPGPLRD